jgi:hypothetical protein
VIAIMTESTSPLTRYASLLRTLPDKPVPNPRQPVLVSLSEQIGAPTGLSVNVNGLLDWATAQRQLSPSTLFKVRETFEIWDQKRPTRHEIADFLEWLATMMDTPPAGV